MLLLKPGNPSPVILYFIPRKHVTTSLVDIQLMYEEVFQLLAAMYRNRVKANLLAIEFAYTQALI